MANTPTEPPPCTDYCPVRGKWGATGILPPNHHVHYTDNGQYLAHGEPSGSDLAKYIGGVVAEYDRRVNAAREYLAARLLAVGA